MSSDDENDENDDQIFSIFNVKRNKYNYLSEEQNEKEDEYRNESNCPSKEKLIMNEKEIKNVPIQLDEEFNKESNNNKEFDENNNNNEKEEINNMNMVNFNKNEKTTTNTKRGRIKLSDSISEHTKDAIDNKIRKIRIHAITFGIDLINNCIKKELKKQYRKENLILRGISREITADITITFNNVFFESPLEIIYSNPLNKKYSNFPPDSNIKVIKKLKEINNPIINQLLSMKFKDLFSLFVKSDRDYLKNEFGFKKGETFEDFINSLENENEEYISSLREMVKGDNFLKFFKQEKARTSKNKKEKFSETNFREIIEN